MTEITVEITKSCRHQCPYCSTDAVPDGPHLDKEIILKFLEEQDRKCTITRINISGGEPLAHPDFYEILRTCYCYTKNVWVYTNALTQIMFNADVIEGVKVEANVCIVQGETTYIPKDVNRVHLLKLVRQGRAKNLPEQNVTVSGNFYPECEKKCGSCDHVYLQADGEIVASPCRKKY
jgi:hypothetical protein